MFISFVCGKKSLEHAHANLCFNLDTNEMECASTGGREKNSDSIDYYVLVAECFIIWILFCWHDQWVCQRCKSILRLLWGIYSWRSSFWNQSSALHYIQRVSGWANDKLFERERYDVLLCSRGNDLLRKFSHSKLQYEPIDVSDTETEVRYVIRLFSFVAFILPLSGIILPVFQWIKKIFFFLKITIKNNVFH